ncbi:Lactation elevated protein 1 [Hordeum vulgare]|nr:Lactation elevated protein 1 [Hordeum vulgare]
MLLPPQRDVFDEMAGSGGSNNATVEFVNLLDTNAVDINQSPFADFDYNEIEGGMDDHGGEDEVEKDMLKEYDKWKLIKKESPPKRGSLKNMDEDEDVDGPRNLNKPDDDKKTKEKIKREHEASNLRDRIDAMVQSNELMLAKTLETKKELAEKKAREKQEKWQLLKDEGLRKAAIEERRARAAENKAMSKLLAEENRIMTLNRNDMDDITKE